MKTTLFRLTLAALSVTSMLRAGEPNRPPINPALLYWQAAALLPEFKPEQSTLLNDLASGHQPFDEKAAKGLPNCEGSLRLARKAAESTAPCDWGLLVEDGPEMTLPHIAKLRQIASILLVQADIQFADGKINDGLESVLTVHRLARHAGAGDLLIGNLVQYAIETNVLRTAARHCLGWDTPTRHAYAEMIQNLPPLHTTQAAYRGEHLFVDWLDRKLTQVAEHNGDRENLIKTLVGDIKPAEKEALAEDLAPATFHAALTELRSLENRAETALGKPWAQAQPELTTLNEEAIHNTHYLVSLAFPATVAIGEKQFAIATLHTMLGAALEHGSQLDEAMASGYHDAFEGESLLLKKNADGTYTLSTRHQHPAGKELSLAFGK
jgi:hypothetical protein